MNPVTDLIQLLGDGSVVECARRLSDAFGESITYQAVRKWEAIGKVPLERVLDVSKATGWKRTPHQIAPTQYPHPDDGLPVELRGLTAQSAGRGGDAMQRAANG